MAEEKSFENLVKQFFINNHIYPAGCPVQKQERPKNGWFFKVWGGGFQKSGIPDIVMNVCGDFVAVELKAQSGHPSDIQKHNVKQIRESCGQACFLYPSGFEAFKRDICELIDTGDVILKEVYK